MLCDLPFLRRCCFCCPLRPGLIVWGYLKLTVVMILFAIASIILSDIVKGYVHDTSNGLSEILLICWSVMLLLLLIDGIFHFVFLLSAHTKNPELMKSYLCYNIFLFTVSNIAFFLVLGYFVSSYTYPDTVFLCLGIGFINSVIQFYLILLIRSEIKKLSNDGYVTFENHGGNPQCFMTVGKQKIASNQPRADQQVLINDSPYDVPYAN